MESISISNTDTEGTQRSVRIREVSVLERSLNDDATRKSVLYFQFEN